MYTIDNSLTLSTLSLSISDIRIITRLTTISLSLSQSQRPDLLVPLGDVADAHLLFDRVNAPCENSAEGIFDTGDTLPGLQRTPVAIAGVEVVIITFHRHQPPR
jgi:hypothetical protein